MYYMLLSLAYSAILVAEADAKHTLNIPASPLLHGQRLEDYILNHTCPNANSPILSIWQEQNSICGIEVPNSIPSNNETSSNMNIHHPWNSATECLTQPQPNRDFCIYTSSKFANHRGLSLFTTPDIASIISSLSTFTTPSETQPTLAQFYETSLPGRGKGLIANQSIERGSLILSSSPVLIVDEEIFDIFTDEHRFPFQRKAIDRLPSETKKLFYGLAGHFGGDEVEDRIKTNTFSAIFGDRKHGVVVPEAARLNHDCRPNARFAFDPETLTHKVHALRDIEVGEELTISYIDEKQLFAVRQSQIHNHWGFNCTCKTCSLPPLHRKFSDTRLSTLAKLRTQLLDFRPGSPTTPNMAVKYVELSEEEGLYGALPEAYMLAAIRYCMWEDPGKTRDYAREAVARWMVWEKRGEENRRSLMRIGREPMGGWCWGLARMEGVGNRDL